MMLPSITEHTFPYNLSVVDSRRRRCLRSLSMLAMPSKALLVLVRLSEKLHTLRKQLKMCGLNNNGYRASLYSSDTYRSVQQSAKTAKYTVYQNQDPTSTCSQSSSLHISDSRWFPKLNHLKYEVELSRVIYRDNIMTYCCSSFYDLPLCV
jgi:hypothetical protein